VAIRAFVSAWTEVAAEASLRPISGCAVRSPSSDGRRHATGVGILRTPVAGAKSDDQLWEFSVNRKLNSVNQPALHVAHQPMPQVKAATVR
jgi:hypothetical protein